MKIQTNKCETIEVEEAAQSRLHVAVRVAETGYWYRGSAIIYLTPADALKVALELVRLALLVRRRK